MILDPKLRTTSRPRRLRFLLLATVTAIAAGALAPSAPAQAPEVAAADPDTAVREKVYYVPYEELEQVFEAAGRGIFLPYDEFLRLWRKAEGTPADVPDTPPAPTVVRGGHYRGAVAERSARLEASYSVESLAEGWTETRFLLGDVAIESVTVSDPEALFVARDGAYSLFLPRPGTYELDLVLSVPVLEQPGKKSIRFGIPSVAVSRLELSIPEEDLRVDVEPILAATRTEHGDGTTEVLAFLGDTGSVTVSWMPPVGRAAEGGALVSAEQTARASLDERILRVASRFDFAVLRGEVSDFRIVLPTAMQLIAVRGENLKVWRPDGGILGVELHAAVTGTYALELEFERILDAVPPTLTVPFPRAEGMFRESGLVTFEHDPGLRIRTTATEGLSQLDPEEIPQALRAPGRAGYRYLAPPISLTLDVETIEPQVRSETVSVIRLDRTEDHWIGWVDLTITRAGLFQVALRVPGGWEVESVGDPNTVEEFQVEDGPAGRTIRVSLRSRALGAFRLPFRLVREGTARAGEVTVSPPVVIGSEQDRGVLGVSAPRAFEMITSERNELLDADVDELFRTGILGQLSAESAIPRAFRYRGQPASATLTLTERRTEIDLLAQHLVDVGDGEIRITHFLDHEILYAAVDAVRFRAPSALDDQITVEAKQKTQVRKVSSEGGTTLWEVGLQPPALGSLTLTIHHTIPLPALEAGVPREIPIPLVEGVGTRGTQGYVAIRKEGTLEVAPDASGMEGIDTGDLPDKLRRGRIYGGFRYFTAEPSLALELTRYDHETLATAVVTLMRLRSVLSEERSLQTEAVLWVQNADRQFLELVLPGDSTILSLSVNGRAQAPKRRKEGTGTLIEIPRSAGPAGTFPIVVNYEQTVGGGTMGSLGRVRVATPEVLADVPVNEIELDLYLPAGYAYLGWGGNLHGRVTPSPGTWERFKDLFGLAGEADSGSIVRGGRATTRLPEAMAIPLPTEGRVLHRFRTLAPRGELRFRFYGRTLYAFIDFLLFLGAALATWVVLMHRVRSKPIGAAVLIFLALTYVWFTQGPARGFSGSVLGGVVVVCLGLLVHAVHLRWRAHRAERLRLAPDPFIEEAPPRPSTRSEAAAPSTTDRGGASESAAEAPATPEGDVPPVEEPEPTEGSGEESSAPPRKKRGRKKTEGEKKTTRKKTSRRKRDDEADGEGS